MSVLNICSILPLLLKLTATQAGDSQQAPLEIIWHVPTQGKWGCGEQFGIPIDVTQYGMLENSNPGSDGLQGDVISILYQNLGKWPFIEDDGHWKDGGLPQSGDIAAHLAKVEEDIVNHKKIPQDFSGLGVLDFEEWFAIWDMNFKNGIKQKYRDESISLANSEEVAIEEYNQAAKEFFEKTLLKAKELRPNAIWGYYIYPKCNYKTATQRCAPHMYDFVKQLDWLVKDSDVLYPSVYYNGDKTPHEARPGMVFGAVNVSREWLEYVEKPHKPIYMYAKTTLKNVPPYYSDFDLIASLGTAADMGINGIIIWGSKLRRESKALCEGEKEHLEKLGPYVQKLLNFFENCSRDLCSSNGRCAKNQVEVDSSKINSDLDADHVYVLADVVQQYHCRCYEGWKGQDCGQTV